MKDPNFDIAFSIGRFHIYWYAILLALGIAAALMITDRRAKGRAVPKDIALDLCILGLPFGILGARLFACLSGSVPFSRFLDLTKPGLSFFGGIVMAAAAILVYLKQKKVPLGEMLDYSLRAFLPASASRCGAIFSTGSIMAPWWREPAISGFRWPPSDRI